jgi:hypothetical protein
MRLAIGAALGAAVAALALVLAYRVASTSRGAFFAGLCGPAGVAVCSAGWMLVDENLFPDGILRALEELVLTAVIGGIVYGIPCGVILGRLASFAARASVHRTPDAADRALLQAGLWSAFVTVLEVLFARHIFNCMLGFHCAGEGLRAPAALSLAAEAAVVTSLAGACFGALAVAWRAQAKRRLLRGELGDLRVQVDGAGRVGLYRPRTGESYRVGAGAGDLLADVSAWITPEDAEREAAHPRRHRL